MIYRALEAIPQRPGSDKIAAQPGDLLFAWRASRPTLEPGQVALSTRPDGWGSQITAYTDKVECAPDPRASEFEQLLGYYFEGHANLPNAVPGTPETLNADLNMIACGGGLKVWPGVVNIRLSGMQRPVWARAFLQTTQGGQYDGKGVAILYTQSSPDAPRTVRFAVCDHEIVEGTGANHSRGWHPARCSKCGLDLSVDSGD